jgi:hypothetical protein
VRRHSKLHKQHTEQRKTGDQGAKLRKNFHDEENYTLIS